MEAEPTILLPGSFNPIHKGHLSIAENVLRAMPEATLWLVVSPQNPLKSPAELAAERHRLQMARIAVGRLRSESAWPSATSSSRCPSRR
ncbi:MAG: nicotinate-nicotinamide nucleotide adenylyltransferase [Alistipes sp.]